MQTAAKKYRVLVVDDELDVRALLMRALRELDVRTDEADDGISAQNALRAYRYDAVVTDLRMPRMNGHRFAVELLATNSPPLVLVMTAIAEPRIVTDLITRGVADVVLKPLDYYVLAAKIVAYLDRRSAAASIGDAGTSEDPGRNTARDSSGLRSELETVSATFQSSIRELERKKEGLEDEFLGALRILTGVLDQSSSGATTHVMRVGNMAAWVAQEKCLPLEMARDIEAAALLHEIGQCGMPTNVRGKPPWALTPDERAVYQHYPTLGAVILSELPNGGRILEFVENHAERFDGTGFPSGKSGGSIPLGAQIVGVCDGADTYMMHADPRDAVRLAGEFLRGQSGKTFDPGLVSFVFQYLNQTAYRKTFNTKPPIVISARDLTPGHVIAEDVFDSSGRFLLRARTHVAESNIKRIAAVIGKHRVSAYTATDTHASGYNPLR